MTPDSPATSFDQLPLAPPVAAGVRASGYTTLTPVQAATLPIALRGVDVVGVAQTGTGKTASFVLPILDYLVRDRTAGRRTIRALVVTPTRELAIQVEASVQTYGVETGLRSVCIYGGVGKQPQREALRRGIDIVVATPGRLLDLLGEGVLKLNAVDVLVLDEADRMFDMGFLKDLRRIVAAVPTERQTMLFSATMPREIEALAREVLHEPEWIEVGQRRDPAASVAQHALPVAEGDKPAVLQHLLGTEGVEKSIVFSRTKHRADRIAKALNRAGVDAVAIHSNRSQNQRQRALEGFEAGEFRVLVATDIAARGLDLDGVSHVINYDVPNIPEDYIHRIGRTGRAAATGDAISLVSAEEAPNLHGIEKHTGKKIDRMTLDGFAPLHLPEPSRGTSRAIGKAVAKPSSKRSGGRRR